MMRGVLDMNSFAAVLGENFRVSVAFIFFVSVSDPALADHDFFWNLGDWLDGAYDVATAQSEMERNVDEVFPACSGGTWSVDGSDAFGPLRYEFVSSNASCGFGTSAAIT